MLNLADEMFLPPSPSLATTWTIIPCQRENRRRSYMMCCAVPFYFSSNEYNKTPIIAPLRLNNFRNVYSVKHNSDYNMYKRYPHESMFI